ncbi:MAG TPA: YetF domain-containing protein, partial [Pseudoneobacillus sp.]|nr:YetF domain-containing protein [Pseudoneobacillus sp.]
MEFVHIFAELVVGYIALFILAKVLGKTQITQITTFDFISAVVVGELVGNALFDEEIGIKKILFAVIIWGTLIYTTEIITQKFKRVRKTLEGEPSIVIRRGKIDYHQLKINKLDINQLQHLLRSKDIF